MIIKDNKLGPIFTVYAIHSILSDRMVLIVNRPYPLVPIPKDDINDTVSNAFIYIVEKFIKANDIDFKPNGDFDSEILEQGEWCFRIYGSPVDPMEYFINSLK